MLSTTVELSNFLRWHFQITDCVVAINKVSSWIEVTSGVHQGSIIGPTLFVLFIDQLRNFSPCCRYIKYADDLSVLCSSPDVVDTLQEELSHINRWCLNNAMVLNLDKTQVIHFNRCTNGQLLYQQHIIQPVNQLKMLGIMLQSNLRWNCHVDQVCKRASRSLYGILQLKRHGCSVEIMWRAYYALVRSIITYSFPAFCNLPTSLFNDLLKIERRASSIIGSPISITLDNFTSSQCANLARIVNYNSNHPLRELFEIKQVSSTRSKSVLLPPNCKSSRRVNSFVKYDAS